MISIINISLNNLTQNLVITRAVLVPALASVLTLRIPAAWRTLADIELEHELLYNIKITYYTS